MARYVTTIAVLAVLLAGGVSLWTVLHQSPPAAPAPPVANVASSAPSAPPPAPRSAVAATVKPATDQPALSPTPSLATINPATDPAAFVASLSDQKKDELLGLLSRKEIDRSRQRDRHKLMSDWRLQALKTSVAWKLTEAQMQQVDQLKAAYKPQMEALLADNWAKQDEVLSRFESVLAGLSAPADSAAKSAALRDESSQLYALQQQADEIAQPLDRQYAAAVRTVLTADQLAAFDQVVVVRQPGGGLYISLKGDAARKR